VAYSILNIVMYGAAIFGSGRLRLGTQDQDCR
jgi:hypothetical protein